MQRPDLLFEGLSPDFGDGIRFLHVASELGKDFVVRHANADGQAEFLSAGLADLLCNLHSSAIQLAAGYIQLAFIHTERLHEVGISLVDRLGQF